MRRSFSCLWMVVLCSAVLAGCGRDSRAGSSASPDVAKLPKLKNGTLNYVDDINNVSNLDGLLYFPGATNLTVLGWAVDSPNSQPAAAIWIDLDGKNYQAQYGISRPDVAAVYKVSQYMSSGFSAVIPTLDLNNSVHRLTLKIVNHDASGYYVGRSFRFDMK